MRSSPSGLVVGRRYLVYDGPSMLTGRPIIMMLTSPPTDNEKLGRHWWQTWTLTRNIKPSLAIKTGRDEDVCGDCHFRPFARALAKRRKMPVEDSQPCYVVVPSAPRAVWEAWKAGNYELLPESGVAPDYTRLRFGAYGEAVAVKVEAASRLVEFFPRLEDGKPRIIGYTQRWLSCDQWWRHYLMASVNSPREAVAASAIGWRWYRSREWDEPIRKGEFECPASAEQGHRLQCYGCMACYGAMPDRIVQPASVVSYKH